MKIVLHALFKLQGILLFSGKFSVLCRALCFFVLFRLNLGIDHPSRLVFVNYQSTKSDDTSENKNSSYKHSEFKPKTLM